MMGRVDIPKEDNLIYELAINIIYIRNYYNSNSWDNFFFFKENNE